MSEDTPIPAASDATPAPIDPNAMLFDSPGALQASLLEPIQDPTGGMLAPLIAEFAKMQQALKKSHDSEARFVNKCRELAQTLQEVNERSAELDAEEIENRKKLDVLQRQNQLADEQKAGLEKDLAERREKINAARLEVNALKRQMETWSHVLVDQQQKAIGTLEQELSSLTAVRDKTLRHLTFVRGETAALYSKVDILEQETQRQQADINDLQRRISDIDSSCRVEMERKEELEQKAAELKEQCEQQSLDISRKLERTKKAKQELAKERSQLKETLKNGTTSTARLTQLNEEAQDLEDQFQAQQDAADDLVKAIAALEAAGAHDREVLDAAADEAARKLAMLEKLRDKMQAADNDLRVIEATRASWNDKIEVRKQELKAAQTAAAVALRAIDIASREREVLNHDHASVLQALTSKKNQLHIAENQSRNMEIELKAFEASVKAWKTLIDHLAQDTDSFKNELEAKQAKTRHAMEKAAAKDAQIVAMQKTIIEYEARRRQQMNLLEAVKSDRNLYSKTLMEQKHEMAELRKVFDSLNHQIAHMQQELNEKEAAYVSENLLVEQVDEDIRQTEQKTKHIQECYNRTCDHVRSQASKILKLTRIIDEADLELAAQTKQYNAVVDEERVLARQLVKRNEELGQVYEGLRLDHSMMQKGELQYRERQEALRKLLTVEKALRAELESIDSDRSEVDQLQRQLLQLEKVLSQENLKARALQDEVNKPMNIHRWRQLQDTNAETYTLIESIQSLQRQIIAKTTELAQKDARIEAKERLYVDLKRVQARQLGQEADEQLRIYEATIKDKTAKHKVMVAELKMCQAKVQELKYDIEKIYKQLDLVKVTYFQQRRAQARQSESGTHLTDDVTVAGTPSPPGAPESRLSFGRQEGSVAAFAVQNSAV